MLLPAFGIAAAKAACLFAAHVEIRSTPIQQQIFSRSPSSGDLPLVSTSLSRDKQREENSINSLPIETILQPFRSALSLSLFLSLSPVVGQSASLARAAALALGAFSIVNPN